MIWSNIEALAEHLETIRQNTIIVATSGGFDPLHIGHCRCILSSSQMGELIVIVNGDEFLLHKKGYIFMPHAERLEIIDSLRGVAHVVGWYDGTQFIDGALKILKPNLFTKGGDRSQLANIADCERRICLEIGCRIILGVGGSDKPQSSSVLVGRNNQRNQ